MYFGHMYMEICAIENIIIIYYYLIIIIIIIVMIIVLSKMMLLRPRDPKRRGRTKWWQFHY